MPLTKYRPAWWVRWLGRPFVRVVLGAIMLLISRVKITGKKNIPRGKAYIVAINHVSLYEAPFMGAFWPRQLEVMGAVDVWSKPGQNILARLWGGIKVHRGEYDRALFETVLSALESGYPVLIAPEGGRSHEPGMHAAKPGIAYLVERSGVPVVPVGIVGTTDDYWHKASHGERPLLEMRIGKPIVLPPVTGRGEERRASRQANTDLVMRHLAGLLPPEYRGVYAANPIFPDPKTDQ